MAVNVGGAVETRIKTAFSRSGVFNVEKEAS
jgi:hypothetical protein